MGRMPQPSTQLWKYWISCAFYGLSTSIFDSLYALHLRAMSFREDQIGIIFAVGSVTMAVTLIAMIATPLKTDTSVMFKASSGMFATCMLFFPFLHSVTEHIVVFAICGAASAIMMSTGSAAMLCFVDEGDSRRFFNMYFVVFLLSSGFGTLSIAVIELTSEQERGIDLFTGFLVVAGLLAFAMASVRFLIKFPLILQQNPTPGKSRLMVGALRSHFAFIFLSALFIGASSVLSIRFINLLLVERLRLNLEQALIWLSVERFICLATLVFFAARFRARDPNVASAVLLVFSAMFLASAAFSYIPMVFGFLYLARQAAHYSQQPLMEHISFEGVPETERAHAAFVRRLGLFLGSAVGALCYGELLARDGAMPAMLLAAAFAALAAAIYFIRVFGFFRITRALSATQRGDNINVVD